METDWASPHAFQLQGPWEAGGAPLGGNRDVEWLLRGHGSFAGWRLGTVPGGTGLEVTAIVYLMRHGDRTLTGLELPIRK